MEAVLSNTGEHQTYVEGKCTIYKKVGEEREKSKKTAEKGKTGVE